jgi:hypothetical protein
MPHGHTPGERRRPDPEEHPMANTENTQDTGTTKATATPKGPQSYFPSIEKKYGRPIAEWQQVVRDHGSIEYKVLVAHLKEEHGMGHGHANAVVLHTLREDGHR